MTRRLLWIVLFMVVVSIAIFVFSVLPRITSRYDQAWKMNREPVVVNGIFLSVRGL